MDQKNNTAARECAPAEPASDSGLTCGKASCHACHHKKTPRSEAELKSLKNRLNRISGQLAGISRMLKEHMETCVVEEVQNGNTQIVEEAFELMRKLK